MLAKIINDVVEKYPYSIGQLRKDNANVSFPKNPSAEVLAQFNAFDVVRTAQPEVNYTQEVHEGVPQKVNNVWTQVWDVSNLDEDALAQRTVDQANNVRSERDYKLSQTDWRFRSDMNPSQDWIDYCQALRDVPAQAGFPWSVTWPEAPTGE